MSPEPNDTRELNYRYKINLISHPGIRNIINNNYESFAFDLHFNTPGEPAYINTYLPVKDKNGKLNYVICISYRWSDIVSSDTSKSLNISIVSIIVGIIITEILIIIFLYFKAFLPLERVKTSIKYYMETKDSSLVHERMSKIHSKNELEDLAADVSNLSYELDNYTSDNIKLAKKKEKISYELGLAATIQDSMLIKEFPKKDEYIIHASMTPAKEVGGDFYDFFEIDEDHLCLTIADVSGKGIPASMVMMSALTSIRNYAKLIKDPAEILENLNEESCNDSINDMFVTVWLGILDLNTGIMTTSNAGHEFPAINTSGRFELFKDKHSFVIGGMNGVPYFNETIELKKGDLLFVYTDGVPESSNEKKELFGTDRMIETLNSCPDPDPESILASIKKATTEFSGEAPQFDDLTMLCIEYFGRG